MVKAKLFDKNGKVKGELTLTKNFSAKIREDILAKVFETQKLIYTQAYGTKKGAGAQYSASGISKKKRPIWR